MTSRSDYLLEIAIERETSLTNRRPPGANDADLPVAQDVLTRSKEAHFFGSIGPARAWTIANSTLHQSNLSCLFLLALAAFLSAAADRLLQIKLGAISVFIGPATDNIGSGLTYMILPMALLLVPIALFFNDAAKRLNYLQGAMLLKALLAIVLSLDLTRQFLSEASYLVGYALSMIFLAGEWTVICMVLYLSERAPRPLIYVSALGASYFLGQTAALVLSPYVVSRPFSNTFAAAISIIYLIAFYAAKCCQHQRFAGRQAFERRAIEAKLGANRETNLEAKIEPEDAEISSGHYRTASGLGRLLAATTILYTPLYLGLLLPLFYALQGYQVGTLTFAHLAAKGAMAFALGACASIFLHHLASRRRVLQIVAAGTVCLATAGALSYSYDISLFTLLAVQTLAGFITPDWENHLLSILPLRTQGPFFAARNTLVMVFIALLSPPVERTLAAVSALYVLKELNILVLAAALFAMLLAPLLLGRPQQVRALLIPRDLQDNQKERAGQC
ncbi:MAG: hypothetical protein KGS72_26220 [Cyanobacteria bacterium REEB67]|nr:hypothetical protein [Cyanobacteria bacterium REEB67]